jgi:acetyl esterase/lipase
MRTDAGAAQVHVQDDLERVLVEALLLLDVVVLAVNLRLAFEDLVQAELLDAAAILLIVVSSEPLLKLLVVHVNRQVA